MIENKNKRGLWITTFIIVIIFWLFLGSTIINLYANIIYSIDTNQIFFNSIIYNYIGVNLPFLCITLGFYFSFKYINKIHIVELINSSTKIDKPLFFKTLLVSLGYFILITIIGSLFNLYELKTIETTFTNRILFILLAIIFTPIQVLAEEVLFRSIIIKMIIKNYDALKNRKLIYSVLFSFIVGFIFIIPHLSNPEISTNFISAILYYFIFGSFATFSILISNGLEIPIAIHLANNLLIALFCNYENSALPSFSLFLRINESSFSKYYEVITLILLFIIIGIHNKLKIVKYCDKD
ncbi:MAG: CPBP family intramembrane glutamic endopeptidase [Pleomorphochaeta sp.]